MLKNLYTVKVRFIACSIGGLTVIISTGMIKGFTLSICSFDLSLMRDTKDAA